MHSKLARLFFVAYFAALFAKLLSKLGQAFCAPFIFQFKTHLNFMHQSKYSLSCLAGSTFPPPERGVPGILNFLNCSGRTHNPSSL